MAGLRPTAVTGSVNFACGQRIAYDDANRQHQANRLCRTSSRPLITCPQHGPEAASCAVSGPAALLWPDAAERAEVLLDIARERSEWNVGGAA